MPHELRYLENQLCHPRMTDLFDVSFSVTNPDRVNSQRERYSGSPVRKVSSPLILAFEFGGNSKGKLSRVIMTIEQYAPLRLLTTY